ncbi:MAG: glycosyltransferase family 2 protein [Flavobacteriaceae bacterium]|jgi:glycosyltransferase involved in cell wall biosynthesis|nr:glycosyltransferase family 2 protein [Flavobacteriaceae bacterium]MBT6447121.1 glycosyltransferase family 2 protein [Flavobacteriaceae bacterium]
MKPLISVVLITYNRPNYLKECIDSILSQTFKQFELFILDNGSDCSTKDIINQFSDKRIKYIRNKINSKSFINKGFEFTKNKYLIITHDDDIMKNNFLDIQLGYLENDLTIDVAASSISLINNEGKKLNKTRPRILKNKSWNKYEFINYYIFFGDIIPCPTCIFRSNFIKSNKLKFDENVGPAADLHLLFRINCMDSKIFLNKTPLYNYRIHSNQDSNINRINMEYEIKPHIIKLLNNKQLFSTSQKYVNASNGIIMNIILNEFISGKIHFNLVKNNLNRLINEGFKINFITVYWTLIGVMRGLKNLLIR